MNNLKLFREARGLTQKELAALVKNTDPRIDAIWISRFENGMCLPTPIIEEALASALSVPSVFIFGGAEQTAISGVVSADESTAPLLFELEELLGELRVGAENARSRSELAEACDCSDRELRRRVAELRRNGYCVCNVGKGYYISTDRADLEQYYRTEYGRAMAILKTASNVRRLLKQTGGTK